MLAFYDDEATLRHTRSKHNKEDDGLRPLISPFIPARFAASSIA